MKKPTNPPSYNSQAKHLKDTHTSCNRIDGFGLDHVFEPCSGQTKDFVSTRGLLFLWASTNNQTEYVSLVQKAHYHHNLNEI